MSLEKRRIKVRPAKESLQIILQNQLQFIVHVSSQRPLQLEEIKLLEILLKTQATINQKAETEIIDVTPKQITNKSNEELLKTINGKT